MKKSVFTLFILLIAATANAKVVSKDISYKDGDTKLVGTIVYDDAAKGRHPGVLVLPDIWGRDGQTRKRAYMLAELGYVALVADLYGATVHPKTFDEAQQQATKLLADPKQVESRFKAAEKTLKARKDVNTKKIAAIGYGLGGGVALDMARLGLDLRAVASFYGYLTTAHPAQKGKVKAQILVANGALDPLVDPKQVQAIQTEMKNAGVTLFVLNFPNAKHRFTDPQANQVGTIYKQPYAYDADADLVSWRTATALLNQNLKK